MNKIVRWPGLIVFLVIIGLLLGAGLLFASSIVRQAIEIAGTSMVGAKVDVGRVELSLAPLGFHVYDLQVTDPSTPMINAFQIDDIEFFLDFPQLLQLKTLVHDMHIKRLRVKTKRTESGAILQPAKTVETEEAAAIADNKVDAEFPSLREFDVDEIFNREELKSVEHLNRMRATIMQEQAVWDTKLAGLPNGKKVENYRNTLENLSFKSSNDVAADIERLRRLVDEAKKLRGEIRTDFDHVDAARRDAGTTLKDLHASLLRFKALPEQDLERIQNKYALSPAGLANISDLLFGEKIRYWVSLALSWYEKLQPIYERFEKNDAQDAEQHRASGVDIRFPEHNAYPDFLVHRASISMELAVGKINGEIRNLTSDQSMLGHPLTFNLFSKEMQGVKDIEIVGSLNHVNPEKSTDSVSVKATSIQAREIKLLASEQFPLRLAAAEMDLDSKVELIGSNIGSNMTVAFRNADFSVVFEDKPSAIAVAMASALQRVKNFDTQVTLSGTLKNYGMSVKSSLDEVLKKAIGEQVSRTAAEFKAKVRKELDKRIAEPRANVNREVDRVKAMTEMLENRVKDLASLRDRTEKRGQELEAAYQEKLDLKKRQLQRQVDDKLDQQKQTAKEKAKSRGDKLKDELKGRLQR